MVIGSVCTASRFSRFSLLPFTLEVALMELLQREKRLPPNYKANIRKYYLSSKEGRKVRRAGETILESSASSSSSSSSSSVSSDSDSDSDSVVVVSKVAKETKEPLPIPWESIHSPSKHAAVPSSPPALTNVSATPQLPLKKRFGA